MPHSILLQDWTTVRGNAAATVVVQQEDAYADLQGYRDVAVYPEVSDFGGGVQLQVQTSPTNDNAFFVTMTRTTFVITATGPQAPGINRYSEATPLTRFVRWRLSGTGAGWTVTMRIWLIGNPACSSMAPELWLPDSPRHVSRLEASRARAGSRGAHGIISPLEVHHRRR